MLFLFSGAMAVGAAAPADAEPGQAPYIDGQPHTLAAHQSTWYRFEFSVFGPAFLCHFIACRDTQGAHGSVTIRMPGIARSGLGFEIYAPAQMRDWRKEDPVGRGNPEGEDLVWAQAEAGTPEEVAGQVAETLRRGGADAILAAVRGEA